MPNQRLLTPWSAKPIYKNWALRYQTWALGHSDIFSRQPRPPRGYHHLDLLLGEAVCQPQMVSQGGHSGVDFATERAGGEALVHLTMVNQTLAVRVGLSTELAHMWT